MSLAVDRLAVDRRGSGRPTTSSIGPRVAAGPSPESPRSRLSPLETAIIEALAYADVFDWPLTPAELHRYLPIPSRSEAPWAAIEAGGRLKRLVEVRDGYAMFRGRGALVDRRRRLEAASRAASPKAVGYARLVAALPFVQLVALTGSLAVGASDETGDVDLFVVTDDGRVWLARAMAMGAVRAASLRGLRLCPNYLLARSSLRLAERSLFTAHEIAQMVPVVPSPVYDELLRENAWYREFLPNAGPRPPLADDPPGRMLRAARDLVRRPLETGLGDQLERWEMSRKIRRLSLETTSGEARYDATCCKGHTNEHGRRALEGFDARLSAVFPVAPAEAT